MFGRVWVREVEAARCIVPVEVVDVELERDFFCFGSLGCFREGGLARAVVIVLQRMSYIDKGRRQTLLLGDIGNTILTSMVSGPPHSLGFKLE